MRHRSVWFESAKMGLGICLLWLKGVVCSHIQGAQHSVSQIRCQWHGSAGVPKLSQNYFDDRHRATIGPARHFRCPHPGPLPEGWGEGISCYDCVQFKSFETVSPCRRFASRGTGPTGWPRTRARRHLLESASTSDRFRGTRLSFTIGSSATKSLREGNPRPSLKPPFDVNPDRILRPTSRWGIL